MLRNSQQNHFMRGYCLRDNIHLPIQTFTCLFSFTIGLVVFSLDWSHLLQFFQGLYIVPRQRFIYINIYIYKEVVYVWIVNWTSLADENDIILLKIKACILSFKTKICFIKVHHFPSAALKFLLGGNDSLLKKKNAMEIRYC